MEGAYPFGLTVISKPLLNILTTSEFIFDGMIIIPIVSFSIIFYSSELIYTPINPSFGGFSGNGAVLLNQANAENDFKDPDAVENENSILKKSGCQKTLFTFQIHETGLFFFVANWYFIRSEPFFRSVVQ